MKGITVEMLRTIKQWEDKNLKKKNSHTVQIRK